MPQPQPFLDTVLNPQQPMRFTPAMRSQQARGKPYATSHPGEVYEARQKREQAALVLANLEMLVWHANARHESIAQTRHHFQNIVLGLPPDDVLWREEYEVNPEARIRKREDGGITEGSPARGSPGRSAKAKEKDKGKKRVVSTGF